MRKLYLVILVFTVVSCKQQVQNEIEVYNNTFESGSLSNISQGTLSKFNGSTVLGTFNNNNVSIAVNDLSDHDLVKISFDLYIHDNWTGNALAGNQPELWQMLADGKSYISTTFSNLACGVGVFCPPQSYPLDYPNSNHNPKNGAYKTDLPGFCSQQSNPNGTTQYRITKTIPHSSSKFTLELLDKLDKGNSTNPKCDKSWSIDNLVIKTVKL